MNRLYTFAVRRLCEPEDCDFYKLRVPDGVNPLEYFEQETGEHAELCYCSEPRIKRTEANEMLENHKEDKEDG